MIKNSKNYGISFNGHHSTDFGLDVVETSKKLEFPSKNKNILLLPKSNKRIDLSDFGGVQQWTDRKFTIPFLIIDREKWNRDAVYETWPKILEWLMGPNRREPLIDDMQPDFMYLAEVAEAPSLEDAKNYGILTVEFTCNPFRLYLYEEGNDEWDIFSFNDGYAQLVDFDVIGETIINVSLLGMNGVQVHIECDSDFTVSGIAIPKGSSDGLISLNVGNNELKIVGTGHIHFGFRREVL